MGFERGDRVEIMSKEEGFVGSYYPANVIAGLPPGGNNNPSSSSRGYTDYIVQYKTLLKDDGYGLLREIVDASVLRPFPPLVPATGYGVSDVVDAYANDGWWVGKVSGIIGRHYFVYFPTTGEELAYTVDELRIHQDWVHGKWVVDKKLEGTVRRLCF